MKQQGSDECTRGGYCPPPCPACRSTVRRAVFWDAVGTTYACAACGTCTHTGASLSEPGYLYDSRYFLDHYVPRARQLRRFFRDRLVHLGLPPGTVLDVGCGMGFFLHEAKDAGWTVRGVDASPAAVGLAVESGLSTREVRVGTIDDIGGSKAFDLITFWDSLAHMPNAGTALEAAWHLLRPGGVLVVKTPSRTVAHFRRAHLLRRVPGLSTTVLALHTQIHHFSPRSLSRGLHVRGFTEVHTQHVRETKNPNTMRQVIRPTPYFWWLVRYFVYGVSFDKRSFVACGTKPV